MSQKDKLLNRLLTHPVDFTFDEAMILLKWFGYEQHNKGKTSGSRVMFFRKKDMHKIMLHKPHPQNVLKAYMIDDLIRGLKEGGNI